MRVNSRNVYLARKIIDVYHFADRGYGFFSVVCYSRFISLAPSRSKLMRKVCHIRQFRNLHETNYLHIVDLEKMVTLANIMASLNIFAIRW